MWTAWRSAAWVCLILLQKVAMALIIAATFAMTGWTVAAFAGVLPWLDVTVTIGQFQYPQAGIILQGAALALAICLMVYLPANRRILALETSHREFHMTMGDVARAYALAHAEDRRGAFTLSSEFDSIRERIRFLRQHPDLDTLESPVIEAAAQMSHISRELAHTYSDRNVARARDFLVQRQQELVDFEARIGELKVIADDIERWTANVELDEAMAQSRLTHLRETLARVLPELADQPQTQSHPEPAPEPAPEPERTALDRAGDPAVAARVTEGLAAASVAPVPAPNAASGDSNIVALLTARAGAKAH